MTEIIVSELDISLAWYRDRLRMQVERIDAANRFALLRGSDGGRLALKAGHPTPSGIRLHFEVKNLDWELKQFGMEDRISTISPEGYRKIDLRDPDNHLITVFEFLNR